MKMSLIISFIVGVIIGILGVTIGNNFIATKLFPKVEKVLVKDENIKDDGGWGNNIIGNVKKGAKVTHLMKKGNISYVRLDFILPSDSLK